MGFLDSRCLNAHLDPIRAVQYASFLLICLIMPMSSIVYIIICLPSISKDVCSASFLCKIRSFWWPRKQIFDSLSPGGRVWSLKCRQDYIYPPKLLRNVWKFVYFLYHVFKTSLLGMWSYLRRFRSYLVECPVELDLSLLLGNRGHHIQNQVIIIVNFFRFGVLELKILTTRNTLLLIYDNAFIS